MVGSVKRAAPTSVSRTCLRANFVTPSFKMRGNREAEISGTVCVVVAYAKVLQRRRSKRGRRPASRWHVVMHRASACTHMW